MKGQEERYDMEKIASEKNGYITKTILWEHVHGST
jgi:hypothetical protein